MIRIIAFLAFSLLTGLAQAQFSAAQLITLRNLAIADPVAAGYLANGQDNDLAAWYNVSGSCTVWRPVLRADVLREAIVAGAIQLDNLTTGKRDALLYLVSDSLANTAALRTALDDLCGSQNTLKSGIQAAQRRIATRAEAALSTGSCTTASPATLAWEGVITQYEASLIRVAQ